jgi:hypothetical protein
VPRPIDVSASAASVRLDWPGKSDNPREGFFEEPLPRLRVAERFAPPGVGADGWRDLLVHGDNLALLRALLDEPWRDRIAAAGGLRVVYLDPPFLTGTTLQADVQIGDGPGPDGRPRVVRVPAFEDLGARDLPTYLAEMRARLVLVRELLADDGSLYLHSDHRLSPYLRLLLDEVFGPDRFVNEIVWHYGLGNPGNGRAFARKHDTILLYAKTDRYRFNRLRGQVTRAMENKYRHQDAEGRYMLAYGRKYRLKGGKPYDSVWEIPTLSATDRDRWGYPTQKPVALLERIVAASSDPGDLAADLCCGSGTLAVAAHRLGRRWLVADSGRLAVHVARRRLLALRDHPSATNGEWRGFDVAGCRPNLGGDADTAASPSGGPAAVELSVDARLETNGWSARLVAVAVDPHRLIYPGKTRSGDLRRATLTEAPTDALDGWALGRKVETEGGDRFFRADWWSMRTPRRRRLEREASGFEEDAAPLVAVGYDLFGGTSCSAVVIEGN